VGRGIETLREATGFTPVCEVGEEVEGATLCDASASRDVPDVP